MPDLTLSDGGAFLVSASDGDLVGDDANGLYYRDTRHLSVLALRLDGAPLQLLTSGDDDAYRTVAVLTNAYTEGVGRTLLPGSVGAIRTRAISGGAVYERVTLTNYTHASLTLELSLELGADFADLFEVRRITGDAVSRTPSVRRESDGIAFEYAGEDGVTRRTLVAYSAAPGELTLPDTGARARLGWAVTLPEAGEWSVELGYRVTTSESLKATDPAPDYDAAIARLSRSYATWREESTRIVTDRDDVNRALARGARDLRALTATYPTGPLPMAGIPWYAVPFGRDSLITSLQALSFRPELALGTLRFLASRQGERDDPWRDEEPGKIMHELRFGELAGARRIPHTPYYGSVDSTPLFVMLFAETMRWTGDRTLYAELMPHIRRALEWIDRSGDPDRDGYVEYVPRSERGLSSQGWKDSADSLLYPDGTVVGPGAALVEAQTYVYCAKSWLAPVARRCGDAALADRLEREAEALRERFERDFWMHGEGCYAQALDAEKRQIGSVTSNAGHALLGGIAAPERAERTAWRLLESDMAAGWGVRTRSASDTTYNPMSYHNGSVWPHDNSLVALGMYQAGRRDEANEVARQVFAAAPFFRLSRLPELYCGYGPGETGLGRPVDYPATCSPQAWAAGAPLLLMRCILGLEPDALSGTLDVRPQLPSWLGAVDVRGLRVGDGSVDLRVTGTGTEVLRAEGVEVAIA